MIHDSRLSITIISAIGILLMRIIRPTSSFIIYNQSVRPITPASIHSSRRSFSSINSNRGLNTFQQTIRSSPHRNNHIQPKSHLHSQHHSNRLQLKVTTPVVSKLVHTTTRTTALKMVESTTTSTATTSSVVPAALDLSGGDQEATTNTNTNKSDFPEEALEYDTYNGVTVHVSKLPPADYCINTNNTNNDNDNGGSTTNHPDENLFQAALNQSLQLWAEDGKRGIWIHVPSEHSLLIPICVEEGFEFQYAKKGLLVLTKWLPKDSESRLPTGPTHQVGIGAFILHPITGKMLVVQEKSGPASVHNLWKMPTGLTDPGENIEDAAAREVKEETGLDATFDRVICIRQAHGGGTFAQSDMFICCLVKLDSKYMDGNEIALVPQEEEIANIDWMEIDDYANQDLWTKPPSPLYQEMNMCMKRVADEVKGDKLFRIAAADDGALGDDCSNGVQDGNNESADVVPTSGLRSKLLPLGYRDGSLTLLFSKM